MTPSDSPKPRLCIIGTGLMGGSLGLACLKAGAASAVVGYDLDPARSSQALEKGALTEIADSLENAAVADLIVLATPVPSIPEVFRKLAPFLKPGTIVTDVGSTKAGLVEELTAACPPEIEFIGGHPLAGSEAEGIDAAQPGLYDGCFWILTPTKQTDTAAYQKLMRFLSGLNVKVLSLDPARHDAAMALSSHLPQLLSSLLMDFVSDVVSSDEDMPLLAAGGFYDMTRIAASSPQLWMGILKENRQALENLLLRFGEALENLRHSFQAEDWSELERLLLEAREARKALSFKAGVEAVEMVTVRVPVPDRAGVLAEITTTLGRVGINIEDLDIIHSPEGGRGVINLLVNGAVAAQAACEAVSRQGFAAEVI